MKKNFFVKILDLMVVFCFCSAIGCWGGSGNSSRVETAHRISNLPDIPNSELGGDTQVYFDFRKVQQRFREKSQTPEEYVLSTFLKEKVEAVEIYLYAKNECGDYDYYGYWNVPVVNGIGRDQKFLKAQGYRFETWTTGKYGQSFSAVGYCKIEPHTVNTVEILFKRTSSLVVPLCIANPFGVFNKGEYYEIKSVCGFYMWDHMANYQEGKLYFSVLTYEPYDKSEIEFTVFAGTERMMHAYIDIMDILSGEPISLQVTEVAMGTATFSAEFEFEKDVQLVASWNVNSPAGFTTAGENTLVALVNLTNSTSTSIEIETFNPSFKTEYIDDQPRKFRVYGGAMIPENLMCSGTWTPSSGNEINVFPVDEISSGNTVVYSVFLDTRGLANLTLWFAGGDIQYSCEGIAGDQGFINTLIPAEKVLIFPAQ